MLISDTIDDDVIESDHIPSLIQRNVIPQNTRILADPESFDYDYCKILFVYYSWVADSIAANHLAPIEPYLLGYSR